MDGSWSTAVIVYLLHKPNTVGFALAKDTRIDRTAPTLPPLRIYFRGQDI